MVKKEESFASSLLGSKAAYQTRGEPSLTAKLCRAAIGIETFVYVQCLRLHDVRERKIIDGKTVRLRLQRVARDTFDGTGPQLHDQLGRSSREP